MALIPATILTGFLGAGKTTLLNHILKEPHGHRIAVIENEFGPESIDSDILLQERSEQIIEMNNGCICCTVRGDLIAALNSLAQQRAAGTLHFDRVIIETTGLANPGPVTQSFFMDEGVAARYQLDAIVTVVDARHGMQQLDQHEEAQRQAGFADKILLSKTDLVDTDTIATLCQRLRKINPRATITPVSFGAVAIEEVLDLRGFHLSEKLELDPAFLDVPVPEEHAHDHVHDQSCETDCQHGDAHPTAGGHADDISAFVFKSERPFDGARLENFLSQLVYVYGPDMLRYKGILFVEGAEHTVIFQGVHQLMGSDLGRPWQDDETRGSKMVFIGKKLPQDIFISGLTQCLV